MPSQGAQHYMNAVRERLDAIAQSQIEAIDKAAQAVFQTVIEGGVVYLFGTGHSHLLCEEGHYRAGDSRRSALCSTRALCCTRELSLAPARTRQRIGPVVLARYQPTEHDLLFVFSNSGVNTVPVETRDGCQRDWHDCDRRDRCRLCAQVPVGPLAKNSWMLLTLWSTTRGLPVMRWLRSTRLACEWDPCLLLQALLS